MSLPNNKPRPRAFVLEPHPKDLSLANEFGDVIFIYDGKSSRPSIWDNRFVEEALIRLEVHKYDPDYDYVLCVGGLVPTVMFMTAIAEEFPGALTLYYDMPNHCYVERKLGIVNRVLDETFKGIV